MNSGDRKPELRHGIQTRTAGLANMVETHANRYGAVLVAFHRFLFAVENIRMSQPGSPRDAYTCILFNENALVCGLYVLNLTLRLSRPQLSMTQPGVRMRYWKFYREARRVEVPVLRMPFN